ncbi:MAG: aspartate carbamoyltransferase catalytic subunit [Pseudomonadota bacterium]
MTQASDFTKVDRNAFNHQHLIGIEELSSDEINIILDLADYYSERLKDRTFKTRILEDKIILTLFFEDSTRTKTSFDMAAKHLGAQVVHWDAKTSSLNKGETFHDTITTLNAMSPDGVIVRHSEFGAPKTISTLVDCPVINAGDSWNEHPTQALLDALTMRHHFGKLEGLTVAIIGDIAHSRVASSNMKLLSKMGATVRAIAPEILMPKQPPSTEIKKFQSLDEGIDGADVIITIRPQKERMDQALINDQSYFRDYGLTEEKLALTKKETTIVLDPGPFLRNVQISDDLADNKERFIYHKQVSNGIPTRMAVMDLLIKDRN